MPAVQVFSACDIEAVGAGMAGMWWVGIGPQAIHSACCLLGIPRRDWPQIIEDVRYMGREVASLRNQRAAAKERKR